MSAPTDQHGVASAAEQDRRIAALAARNGAEHPITIRHVDDEPERPGRLTAAERVRIHDLRAEGHTLREIAEAAGRSLTTVQTVLKADGDVATPEPEPAAPAPPPESRAPRAAEPEGPGARTQAPPLTAALALLDAELARLEQLRDVRDRLARLIA